MISYMTSVGSPTASPPIARQVELGDLLHVPDPQILEGRALVDAPELLAGIDRARLSVVPGQRFLAPREPAGRALAGGLGIGIRRRVFHALVKGHGDIGAEVGLDPHALLRAHKDLVPVQMGGEGHALLLDFPQTGQREDLKAAGIGQDGSVPRHELVQAAHVAHHLVAGTQVQMIGVGKLDLRADRLEIGGRAPLMAACVPTFIKTGVWTVPCGQLNSPRRAAPSVFNTLNIVFLFHQ